MAVFTTEIPKEYKLNKFTNPGGQLTVFISFIHSASTLKMGGGLNSLNCLSIF
jgi:hypothetical protein